MCRHDIDIAFTLPSIVVTPELLNKNCSHKPSAMLSLSDSSEELAKLTKRNEVARRDRLNERK
jgi:hypothetical protein